MLKMDSFDSRLVSEEISPRLSIWPTPPSGCSSSLSLASWWPGQVLLPWNVGVAVRLFATRIPSWFGGDWGRIATQQDDTAFLAPLLAAPESLVSWLSRITEISQLGSSSRWILAYWTGIARFGVLPTLLKFQYRGLWVLQWS